MRRAWALVVLCVGCDPSSEIDDACLEGKSQEPVRVCLSTTLEPESNPESSRYGQVNCAFIVTGFAGTPFCDCTRRGYAPASDAQVEFAREEQQLRGHCQGSCCEESCSCLLLQLSGDELAACQWPDETESSARGWCYVEPDAGWGDTRTVAECPDTQQRLIRFMPANVIAHGHTGTLACID